MANFNRFGIYKPRGVEDLTPTHEAVLLGIKRGLSFRKIGETIRKSLGTVQIYVEDLVDIELAKRIPNGKKYKIVISEKGEKWTTQNFTPKQGDG